MEISFHTENGMVDLAHLTARDLTAETIGAALAKINRFNGRTRQPWSVAAHSLAVEAMCRNPEQKGWALLHDAHEAFIGDITSPALDLICASGTRTSVENAVHNAKGRLDRVIGAAWQSAPRSHAIDILRADWVVLHAEIAVFFDREAQVTSAQDRDDIERAEDLIRTLCAAGSAGMSHVQSAHRAWVLRAEELASMGLLTLPRDTTPSSAVLAG
jgi:hypothetical protein